LLALAKQDIATIKHDNGKVTAGTRSQMMKIMKNHGGIATIGLIPRAIDLLWA
jgi:hypothetical protein